MAPKAPPVPEPPAPEQHDEQVAINAKQAAEDAANFAAPPAAPGQTVLKLKMARSIGLGYGTRPKNMHLGIALSHVDHQGAIDLNSIEWAEGDHALNERERETLLRNPHLIAAEPETN